MQPTQKQINDFLKNATEKQKHYLLKHAINEKVIDEVLKHYDWKNATEEQKRDILIDATNEKVINEVLKHYDWENAADWQKRYILEYAKSEKVKQLAKKYVVDIYTYLINLK